MRQQRRAPGRVTLCMWNKSGNPLVSQKTAGERAHIRQVSLLGETQFPRNARSRFPFVQSGGCCRGPEKGAQGGRSQASLAGVPRAAVWSRQPVPGTPAGSLEAPPKNRTRSGFLCCKHEDEHRAKTRTNPKNPAARQLLNARRGDTRSSFCPEGRVTSPSCAGAERSSLSLQRNYAPRARHAPCSQSLRRPHAGAVHHQARGLRGRRYRFQGTRNKSNWILTQSHR